MSTDAKPIDMSIGVFSDDQLTRVQHAYALEMLTVLPFYSLNEEIIDLRRRTETARKAFVATEHGICFLKELPWYSSSGEFAAFQAGLLIQLATVGALVSAPYSTVTGLPYYHDRSTGSIFLLQPYLEGRSWTMSEGEARTAGEALATLHGCAAGVELDPYPGMRDVFESASTITALLLEDWAGPQRARDEVHDVARLSLATIERGREESMRSGYGSVRTPVHGDYNPFNLVFAATSDQVVGIVDFDNACLDDRAHDIGESLVRFGWMKYRGLSSAYGAVPTELDMTAVKAMLYGYADRDEAALVAARPVLPAVMTAVALELAAIGLLSSYYTEDDLHAIRRNVSAFPELAHEAIASVLGR